MVAAAGITGAAAGIADGAGIADAAAADRSTQGLKPMAREIFLAQRRIHAAVGRLRARRRNSLRYSHTVGADNA